MSDQSTEVKLVRLMDAQAAMQKEIERNKEEAEEALAIANAKLAALEDERNKALKWGVITLGSAVISMVVWIAGKVMGGHIQ